jgi:hypothetical protein
MIERKISQKSAMLITRVADVVFIEYTCEKLENYKHCEYIFNEAVDRAIQFEEELKWVANIVNGSDFSFYANEEEVIIDHSSLTSISISTGDAGCEFIGH